MADISPDRGIPGVAHTRDRPILFSGPMVRAILEGRKTQTRRALHINAAFDGYTPSGRVVDYYGDGRLGMAFEKLGRSDLILPLKFAPADRLWVREAHYLTNKHAYRLSVGVEQVVHSDGYTACVFKEGFDHCASGLRLRPSIHMPRWASRLTLLVTDVRVQRLQDISEEDAIAEGPVLDDRECTPGQPMCLTDRRYKQVTPRRWFRTLWDSLNGKSGVGWDANPWVVAVTFEPRRCNIDKS